MIKKTIRIMLIMAFLLSLIPSMSLYADTNIKIGDYIIMGKYYDKPILWRCVDINQNGPLMLSDKIIAIKPFDAKGKHPNDTNGYRSKYGSNMWESSNIRSWLNSTSSSGDVKWSCGNPPTESKVLNGYNDYADEKGFLADGNFTAAERSVIKFVTQKSLLNVVDKAAKSGGTKGHIWKGNISEVVANYDSSYYHNLKDKIFLLDVKQINKVWQNRKTLGDNYYIGQLSKEALTNTEYKYKDLLESKKWDYWLRSPYADSDTVDIVRIVRLDGEISYGIAYSNNVGVRPAFYLDLSSAIFNSGVGSAKNPYIFAASKTVVEKSLKEIELTLPDKTNYSISEAFDKTGMKVIANYSDGSKEDITSDVNIKGFDSSKQGVNTISVEYQDKSTEFKVKIDAQTAISFKIGDYIIMGKYYNNPILWRCVDVDENGPLMLSDKVLSIRPFDAKGKHKNDDYLYRADFGSNFWESSNLRAWLNSTAKAGEIIWPCGTPPVADKFSKGYNNYADENGFLSEENFTLTELNVIKTVVQKSLLNEADKDMKQGGKEFHSWEGDISDVVQNYDDAYYHNTNDKMFLLDVKQVYNLWENKSVLGSTYYRAKPATQAITNPQWKLDFLSEEQNCSYWLRTPYTNAHTPYAVRYITADGVVNNASASSFRIGVRPAFYIDSSALNIKSGSGTLQQPYLIEGESEDK